MAKLKNSFKQTNKIQAPGLNSGSLSKSGPPKGPTLKDLSGQIETASRAGSVVQAVSFGALHTKASGSSGSSNWTGLLNAATSGGGFGVLGGGLLSGGALGLIGKLFSLFGGSKSTPSAPVPFVEPPSQVVSITVGSPNAGNSISVGVQSNLVAAGTTGPVYQHSLSTAQEQAAQSAQIVQIVKHALLTSSSLNDVVSEI